MIVRVTQKPGIRQSPPMSNKERQRRFRERNPGYYGEMRRRQKAEWEARSAARLAAEEQARVLAEVKEERREPLMLPAPGVVLELPGTGVFLPTGLPVRETVVVIPGVRAVGM